MFLPIILAVSFWTFNPNISIYQTPSLHTSLLEVLKLSTSMITVFSLFYVGKNLNYKDKIVHTILKQEVTLIVTGASITLGLFLAIPNLHIGLLYNSIFPLIRNTYPVATSIVLGTILVKAFKVLSIKNQKLIIVSFLFILFLFLLHPSDSFGFSSPNNILIYLFAIILGSYSGKDIFGSLNNKKKTIISLTLIVINFFIQIVTPYFVSATGSFNVNRFSVPANFLTIISCYFIFLVIFKTKKSKSSNFSGLLMLLAFAGNPTIKFIFSLKTIGTARAAIFAILLTLAGFIFYFLPITYKLFDFIKNKIHFVRSWESFSNRIKKYRYNLVSFSWFYILSLLSMILMNDSLEISPNTDATHKLIPFIIGTRQSLIIFNALILFIVFKFIYAAIKKYWFSMISVTFILAVIIFVNILKIQSRNEPVLPADLSMISSIGNLIQMISPVQVALVAGALVLTIGLGIVLDKKYKVSYALGRKTRMIWILVLPIFIGTTFFWNHNNLPISRFMNNMGNNPIFYNQLTGARLNGPIVQFFNNIDINAMNKPNGYSKKAIQDIEEKYSFIASSINSNRTNELSDQTIIFNLSESFSNPNRVPGISIESDPIPYINSLKQKTTSGLMLSSGYGGGTANIEYMALTGLSVSNFTPRLSTPYTQLVASGTFNPNIANVFQKSSAIHPYVGTFYSRQQVYKKFGIDNFYFLGSKNKITHQSKIDNSKYLSDDTAYMNALDQINNGSKGQFINLVTMQNHFPYHQDFYLDSSKVGVVIDPSNSTDKRLVQNYTRGIQYTDQYLEKFINEINKIQKPITIIFYGDHLPGIYGNDMNKDFIPLHETDYLIYSNTFAQEHGAIVKNTKNTEVIGPNNLISLAAEQTNSRVSPFMALLSELQQKLPAMSIQPSGEGLMLIDKDGKKVPYKKLTKEQKQILSDYRMVQYDIVAGKHYFKKTDLFSVAEQAD